MLTKEEILNKHDSSRKYIEQTCRPELFAAMEEYAKQEAIEFKKWCEKSGYEKLKREMPLQTLVAIPSEEHLYNIYLEERNKKA